MDLWYFQCHSMTAWKVPRWFHNSPGIMHPWLVWWMWCWHRNAAEGLQRPEGINILKGWVRAEGMERSHVTAENNGECSGWISTQHKWFPPCQNPASGWFGFILWVLARCCACFKEVLLPVLWQPKLDESSNSLSSWYTVLGPGRSLTLYMYISIKINSNQNCSGRDFYFYFLRWFTRVILIWMNFDWDIRVQGQALTWPSDSVVHGVQLLRCWVMCGPAPKAPEIYWPTIELSTWQDPSGCWLKNVFFLFFFFFFFWFPKLASVHFWWWLSVAHHRPKLQYKPLFWPLLCSWLLLFGL